MVDCDAAVEPERAATKTHELIFLRASVTSALQESRARFFVSAKEQVTMPKAVRDVLGLKPGDLVSWDLEGDSVRLTFVPLVDQTFTRSLQAGLSEWACDADETAFADL